MHSLVENPTASQGVGRDFAVEAVGELKLTEELTLEIQDQVGCEPSKVCFVHSLGHC